MKMRLPTAAIALLLLLTLVQLTHAVSSTEQQLDLLAARIAASMNSFFKSPNAVNFTKTPTNPFMTSFNYIAFYAPLSPPIVALFEINTDRKVGDLEYTKAWNGINVWYSPSYDACPECYSSLNKLFSDKNRALFYCKAFKNEEYPEYTVYFESNSRLQNYSDVIDLLTKSCLEFQDELEKMLAAQSATPSPPAPSIAPSPSPSPRASPTPRPATRASPSPSPTASPAASVAPVTGLAAGGESGRAAGFGDEDWLLLNAIALILGLAGVMLFARIKYKLG